MGILNRNLLIDNFLVVIELIDESLDFGVVQFTDSSLIKDYVRVKVNLPELNPDVASIPDEESASDDDEDIKRKHKHKHKSKHKKKSKATKLLEKENLQEALRKNKAKVVDSIKENILNEERWRFGGTDEEINDDEDINDRYMNSYIAKTTIMPISWRTKGIHYGKNEFFLDVIEKVEYFMDFKSGVIRKNLIHGEIICRSYLSGMPKLKISINKILKQDVQFLSNVKFHQCVSLDSIRARSNPPAVEEDGKKKNEEADTLGNKGEIEFIPPDGEFLLCKYELKRHVKDQPMIKLRNFEIIPKLHKFKIKIHVIIETHFKTTNSTSKLNLRIPITNLFQSYRIDLSKQPKFKCEQGTVLFNLSDKFLLWEVGTMNGGHGENTLSMMAEFALFNEEEYKKMEEERKTSMNPPPLREGPKLEELYKKIHEEGDSDEVSTRKKNESLLTMDFEVPYCTCSGLKIEYLKIEEDQLQYQSFPWVRYKTISDDEYAFAV